MTDQDQEQEQGELRKLDAFCAEKVMGYTSAGEMNVDERYRESFKQTIFKVHTNIGRLKTRSHLAVYSRGQCCTFHPTTDPAAAFEVLGKMIERGEKISVSKCQGEFAHMGYYADNELPATEIQDNACYTTAPTLELAICRLAKRIYDQPLQPPMIEEDK